MSEELYNNFRINIDEDLQLCNSKNILINNLQNLDLQKIVRTDKSIEGCKRSTLISLKNNVSGQRFAALIEKYFDNNIELLLQSFPYKYDENKLQQYKTLINNILELKNINIENISENKNILSEGYLDLQSLKNNIKNNIHLKSEKEILNFYYKNIKGENDIDKILNDEYQNMICKKIYKYLEEN